MTISDRSRHELHQRLDDVLGPEQAATLMEHLPPVGWADVATKHDVEHLGSGVRSEMRVLGADLRTEMTVLGSDLRTEIAALGTGVRAEMAAFGTDLRGEMAALGTGLRAEMSAQRGQVSTLFLGLVGLQCTAAGLAVAVSKIL